MNLFENLKNKLIQGLVSRYGPAISISISGAVGGAITKAIDALHAKLGPAAWENVAMVYSWLPDDLEAQLTPDRLGIAAGAVFYAGLQEWLNRRQAKGISAIQKAANSVLPANEKVKVDGVAKHDGETAETVNKVAHRSLAHPASKRVPDTIKRGGFMK